MQAVIYTIYGSWSHGKQYELSESVWLLMVI
jgi:hypothetical protein